MEFKLYSSNIGMRLLSTSSRSQPFSSKANLLHSLMNQFRPYQSDLTKFKQTIGGLNLYHREPQMDPFWYLNGNYYYKQIQSNKLLIHLHKTEWYIHHDH